MEKESEMVYDAVKRMGAPWCGVGDCTDDVVLSFRHYSLWKVNDVAGYDVPNSSSDSFNAVAEEGMSRELSMQGIDAFIGRGSPSWVLEVLSEKRLMDEFLERRHEFDFFCLSPSTPFFIDRLKMNTMRMSFWTAKLPYVFSDKLVRLMACSYKWLTLKGAVLRTMKSSDYVLLANLALSVFNAGANIEAVLFLPAISLLGHAKSVVRAVAEMGGELRPFFVKNHESVGAFFVLAHDGNKPLDYRGRTEYIMDMVSKISKIERGLRKLLMKNHSLKLYRFMCDSEKRLFNIKGIGIKEAVTQLSNQMLGTVLGFFPENSMEMFRGMFSGIGSVTLGTASNYAQKPDEARVMMFREVLERHLYRG